MVKNLSYMSLAYHLVASQDEGHLEVRCCLFDVVDDVLDHFEFVKERNSLLLVVKFGFIRQS